MKTGFLKEEYRSERGSLILETTIVLPFFIIAIVFVMGIFNIVQAQNQMTHTLVQMATSMSMDSYLNEKVNSLSESNPQLTGLDDIFIELKRGALAEDPYFSSKADWYSETGTGANEVARKRFIGYLTGGDEDKAIERLEALGVVDGLSGVEFEVKTEGDDVTITIKYTLQFWADFYGIGKIPMEQSIKVKKW